MKRRLPKKGGSRIGKAAGGRASSQLLPAGYGELLDDLKARVRTAQIKAAVAANRELIQLYWDIGGLIVERQQEERWGTSVIDRLAADLQRAFPGLKGFSASNVSRMRTFYLAYRGSEDAIQAGNLLVGPIPAQPVPKLHGNKNSAQPVPNSRGKEVARLVRQIGGGKVPQPVGRLAAPVPHPLAEIPWGHNVLLLFKLTDRAERLWYAAQTITHGWSRAVLTVQIELDLYGRQGKAVTNFATTLPAPQSDLAQQALKDPYVFDFLTLHDDAVEHELEAALIDHVQKFLLELGAGFAFVGRQVPLPVGDEDFYIDLLFYHLKLRCFVVIDLKTRKFLPDDAGKMNFYLSNVDDNLRHRDDQPSIGLILCKHRNQIIAEYALRDMSKPIGVAEWETKLVQSLPKHLRGTLPTVEEIEAELRKTPLKEIPAGGKKKPAKQRRRK